MLRLHVIGPTLAMVTISGAMVAMVTMRGDRNAIHVYYTISWGERRTLILPVGGIPLCNYYIHQVGEPSGEGEIICRVMYKI